MIRFLQVNYWPLMAICVAVFLLGILLMFVGNRMRRRGERLLGDAQRRHTEALYPPVENYEADYEANYGPPQNVP